jgi:hypothetical protein
MFKPPEAGIFLSGDEVQVAAGRLNDRRITLSAKVQLLKPTKMMVIALFARNDEYFALAKRLCAVHKGRAFQASSPKNLSRSSGRLFFLGILSLDGRA